MNTDYTVHILAEQRRQDFTAEAANDHLARLATADRTSWWHRLWDSVLPKLSPALTVRHHAAH